MTEALAPSRFNRMIDGTSVTFAPAAVLDLPAQLSELKATRAFVVTTGGRSARMAPPGELLGDFLAGTFDRAREHVPGTSIDEAMTAFGRARADVCVAVGGGSAIGLGKAIARRAAVPLVAVPTTYSGSEMTSVWGETGDDGKRTGRDALARPRVVIYDVLLTLSLPLRETAASAMNAMAHAVEAMYAPDSPTPVAADALDAIEMLRDGLGPAIADPGNVHARSLLLGGAHLAGLSLERASMGLHHRICHVLGGRFRLPHARTHAVVLPHVVRFNAPAAPQQMSQIGAVLGDNDVAGALARLSHASGLTETLADLGLDERDIDAAAADVVATPYPNPRPATASDVAGILRAAMRAAVLRH